MSTDICISIERRDSGHWINPVELEAIFPRDAACTRMGFTDFRVCSFSEKGPQRRLFFGSCAVAPMQPGLPDDLCPELQHIRRNRTRETYCGWCLLEDLCLELWQTELVLLGTSVTIELAQFFGNGERLESEVRRDIQQHGVPEHQVDSMLRVWCHLTKTPENWASHRLYQLPQMDTNVPVPVTWRVTYADCAGADLWNDGLSRLQAIRNRESYRLVLHAV